MRVSAVQWPNSATAAPTVPPPAHPSFATWMVAADACALTCGRCACPGQCVCADVPPDGKYNCAQQVQTGGSFELCHVCTLGPLMLSLDPSMLSLLYLLSRRMHRALAHTTSQLAQQAPPLDSALPSRRRGASAARRGWSATAPAPAAAAPAPPTATAPPNPAAATAPPHPLAHPPLRRQPALQQAPPLHPLAPLSLPPPLHRALPLSRNCCSRCSSSWAAAPPQQARHRRLALLALQRAKRTCSILCGELS